MTLVKTAKPNILTNMPPLWLQHDNISPHNRKKKKKEQKNEELFVYDKLQTMYYLQLWRRLSFCAGALHEDLPVLKPIRLWQPRHQEGSTLTNISVWNDSYAISTIWQLSKNGHMDLMPVA